MAPNGFSPRPEDEPRRIHPLEIPTREPDETNGLYVWKEGPRIIAQHPDRVNVAAAAYCYNAYGIEATKRELRLYMEELL